MSAPSSPVGPKTGSRSTPLAERAFAAVPWIGLALVVLTFYWVEASLRKTPWLFADELEWSQLSRGITATGHAARRGEPIGFKSLYAYLIAPAWWIHSTAAAYAAIKYLNVVVMCLAAVPTYLLSRMLVARRTAVAVSVLAVAIPAMSYTQAIVPESLAYLWFAACAWLAVRALAAPTRQAVLLAVAPAALGPLIRKEFVALLISLLAAAAVVWVLRDSRADALRLRWKRAVVAVVVVVVVGVVFNWLVVEQIQSWSVSQYWNRHTVREGALAAGALAIGTGLLPVIGGLASLWLPERRDDPAYRAFAAYLAVSILTLWLYTAAKATYLANVYTSLIEERNLFFLSPLLLLGTALVLGARRIDWRLVAAATALVLATVWSNRLEVGAPYFEAPGLAIPTLVNRNFGWEVGDVQRLLVCAAVVSVVLLAARRRRGVPALAALFVCAWMLTGQIYATVTNTMLADRFSKTLPAPRDWVDQATHGGSVTYLGQQISDHNLLWLTEFWNRSLHHVASLDGSAPGPGPTSAPGLASIDGTLEDPTGDPYVLAGNGIVLQAPLVEERNGMRLYRTTGPWRLLDEKQGIYSDGWMPDKSTYTLLRTGVAGVLIVNLSRTAYTGDAPPGRAKIEVGTVKLDYNGVPELDHVLAVRNAIVHNGKEVTESVRVPSTPVTVVVRIAPTFRTGSDPRDLGAQVAFRFVPDRKAVSPR